MHTLVALPGLHGSTALFDSLRRTRPRGVDLCTLELDPSLASYSELMSGALSRLPSQPFCLLAESFSGPLAIRIAARANVQALFLCASFAASPRPLLSSLAPWRVVGLAPPPLGVLAHFLTGGDRSLAEQVAREISKVSPAVISARLREALTANVVHELSTSACPLHYIRGLRDRLVPRACWLQIQRVRPDSTLTELDAPHLVLQAAPQEAWRAVFDFLG